MCPGGSREVKSGHHKLRNRPLNVAGINNRLALPDTGQGPGRITPRRPQPNFTRPSTRAKAFCTKRQSHNANEVLTKTLTRFETGLLRR